MPPVKKGKVKTGWEAMTVNEKLTNLRNWIWFFQQNDNIAFGTEPPEGPRNGEKNPNPPQ